MILYQYPAHFTYPENEKLFFLDQIPCWEHYLSHLKSKENICLEIGSLYGGSSVYIMDNFCKIGDSHLYIMDINNNNYLETNLSPYRNVTKFFGESADSFKTFNHNGKYKEFLDFIYIDGSHISKYVLEDAVNSFYCLKENGIIVFDDFGGGLEQETHLQVKTALESFVHSYEKFIELIHVDYQVILRKTNKLSKKDYIINYYK